mmetsp:Transcript_12152/g.14177  ORF Transcript_12152/g.14177 Transcript_12152/m.14177 type:complete len:190 (+) Transcript_12152:430-999(+)
MAISTGEKKIAQPVQQLIKRATMIGRNRLSSALTLASVKSITSRLSHDDDMLQMSAAAAAVAREDEEAVDDDDSDDESDDENLDDSSKKKKPGKGNGFFAKTLTVGRRRKKPSSIEKFAKTGGRKGSKQRSNSAATTKTQVESKDMAEAKEAMRTFTRRQPKPPSGPKPTRRSDASGFSLENFDVDEEM